MIIDMSADAQFACRHCVLDAETGERLDERFGIFYADDEAGLIRYYPDDEVVRAYYRDVGVLDVIYAELHRPIRIVPKPVG